MIFWTFLFAGHKKILKMTNRWSNLMKGGVKAGFFKLTERNFVEIRPIFVRTRHVRF